MGTMCSWIFFSALIWVVHGENYMYPPPPLPVAPMPSASQLAFQQRELALFFHFGMNTFTNSEIGTGTENPEIFDPHGLDIGQWMKVARDSGFKLVILTVKHHDGFCLWQTRYSNHSVKRSTWRNGKGDVLQDFVMAAKKEGLEVGVYLSPWDRHEESYGEQVGYNEHYLAQLREILTRYGTISEVWLDGYRDATAPKMNYLFTDWFETIHQLQPNANIFSDGGPDIRWVGDETGEAGSSCWGMVNRSHISIGESDQSYLKEGDPQGTDWVPPECDVSIRPGWFWHESERPLSLKSLLDIYYKSVGRNCVLLLNVPPNTTGLISDEDVEVLLDFGRAVHSIFSVNLVRNAKVHASSVRGASKISAEISPFRATQILDDDLLTYWAPEDAESSVFVELDLQTYKTFNILKVQEAVGFGQRVERYHFDLWTGTEWQVVTRGTTIGYKKLDCFNVVGSTRVRLVLDSSRGPVLLASLGLYLDTISQCHTIQQATLKTYPNKLVDIGHVSKFPTRSIIREPGHQGTTRSRGLAHSDHQGNL